MENQDSLLGVIRTLVKWRKPIIVTTLIAAVGSSIIVLLIPVFFQATTIFYAASPDLSMPERIFGTTNQAMEYYGKDEDIDRIMTIAKSGELAEYLIRTYGLYGHYDIDTTDAKAPYWVREKLDKLYNVQKTKYDAIELSVEDTDPELSARIANDARRKIDEIAQRLIKNSQLEVLKTYESSIAEKQSLLDALSDSLQIIRSRYEVFNTKTQSEILSNMLARAEARFSAAQARKAVFDGRTGVPRDSILFLNAAIAGSSEEVKVLNRKLERFNKGMALVDVLTQQHDEASEQLSQDQERYKQIKAAYNSYFPAIHLVEEAAVPIIKSRPKRTLIVMAATFVAFIVSLIGVLLLQLSKDVKWRTFFDD